MGVLVEEEQNQAKVAKFSSNYEKNVSKMTQNLEFSNQSEMSAKMLNEFT